MADQTGKSKTYSYDYEDYENGKKAGTMLEEILADPEFPGLEELIIVFPQAATNDGQRLQIVMFDHP